MEIDPIGWSGEIIRHKFGSGYGVKTVVGDPAGLWGWVIASDALVDDAAYNDQIGGKPSFQYYFDFIKDHTTGDRDVFIIDFRGRKYHASFAEASIEGVMHTYDLFGLSGVRIEMRRVDGIHYRSDGSIFYPTEVPGIYSWHVGYDFPGGMASWTDLSGNGHDFDPASGDVALTTGTKQVIRNTVTGTIGAAGAGNARMVVTADGMANSPKNIDFAVANNDTASQVATKARAALDLDADFAAFFAAAGGSGANLDLTVNTAAAHDVTMEITLDNLTCTGLVASESTITTNGSIGVQNDLNVLRFNETTDDGSIVMSGSHAIKEIFIAFKIREATFGGTDGIVSGTVAADSAWLVGATGDTKLFNFSHASFSYWKDGVSFTQANQQAPMNAFGLVRVRIDGGLTLANGLQLGWDRDFVGRYAELDFCEMVTLGSVASETDADDMSKYFRKKWATPAAP